ncbi:hypothetical protein FRC06_006063 [Ceratobasidium sp. 370]|nr:hypothetical protein FRC06_006063 [Ceratobasidium sp. 370]
MNSLAPGMKNMISAFGFEWRTAPGEAEAELAYLNNIGVIDAILSDDVDNFLFGARVVIRNPSGTLSGNRSNPVLNKHGKDDGMHVMVYRAADIEKDPACRLTRGGMILIGLLSGGDYDSGAKRCGPKTALALAQLGLGDELLDAFQTLSPERFTDYVPAWKEAVVEALRSGCATVEDGFEGEDEDEETQETAVTASQGEPISASQRSTASISASQQKSKKTSGKVKAKKPPARRQPALAAEIAASDFPDLSVLREYCAPWTSERAFAAGGTTSGPLDEFLPASQGSVITSSQRSTASNSRSKKKAPAALTANSVGSGGLTSDVRIGWKGELALGALGRICEQYFEWGVREIIQHRFRTLLWPAVVLRVLRRSIMEQERVRTRESRSVTPRPSTPTRESAEPIIPGTPRRLVDKHFGGGDSDSDSGSDSEHGPGYVRRERRGGDETPKARRTISADGSQVDPHQLLQGIKGEREHASTDGLREFRVEVAPKHLARLAVRELLGTRDPALLAGTMFDMEATPRGEDDEEEDDGDGDEESIPRRLKMADPAAAVRVWVPAELVQVVHPELIRAWQERGTKSKSKAKLTSGSTTRRKTAKDREGGTAKKGGPSTKTKTSLKEKAKLLPTTLSGDEIEAAPGSRSVTSRGSPPCQPPPKAVAKPQAVSRSSNGLKTKDKEMASAHAVTLSGSDTEVESRPPLPGSSEPLPKPRPRPKPIPAARPDSGSRMTELSSSTRAKPPTHVAASVPTRPSSPTPTIPPVPSGSKARPAARSAASSAPKKKAGIPGVVHVPSPPRRTVTRVGPASDSSELDDVSFRTLLARPEKRPASESDSDSDSEISEGGRPKSPRLSYVQTSPSASKTSRPTTTCRPVVAKPTSPIRRPAPRPHFSSEHSEIEILDPPAPARPSKHKAAEPDAIESRAEDSTSKVARKSRKQTSPRASSASENEKQTKAVGIKKSVAKPRAKAGSSSARTSVLARAAEAVIDIASSSDDSFTILPSLAPKVAVRLGPATDRITRPGELTRLDSRSNRTHKPPGPSKTGAANTSVIDLISD